MPPAKCTYGDPMKIWAGAERAVLAFPDRLDYSCIFAAGQSITAPPFMLSTLPAHSKYRQDRSSAIYRITKCPISYSEAGWDEICPTWLSSTHCVFHSMLSQYMILVAGLQFAPHWPWKIKYFLIGKTNMSLSISDLIFVHVVHKEIWKESYQAFQGCQH